jgi:hypothetical protein
LSLETLERRILLSFLAPLSSGTGGPSPVALAAGDFNGDGIQDLLVSNFGDASDPPGNVTVLLGNGDGTFRQGQSYETRPPHSTPSKLTVADFNGDGKPDFVVLDGQSPSTVSVFLGNGDGTFLAGPAYLTSTQGTTDLAAADLRGDGITDLVVVNVNEGFGGFGSVEVLLGNGDGTFQYPQLFPAGLRPTTVAVADFNGDGKPDLVVASSIRGDFLSVLLGVGDGTFADPLRVPGSDHQAAVVAVGDFNGDGKPDLALAENGTALEVLLGNGDGTFQPGTRYHDAGQQPTSLVAVDLNGDGFLDLATADLGPFFYDHRGVSVLLGNGDGTFQPAQSYPAGSAPFALAVADFNGDGRRDLAVVNRDVKAGNVAVLLGNGEGTFRSTTDLFTGNASPVPVAVGDFTGDGLRDDIAAATNYGDVRVFLGNGDGSFQTGTRYQLPNQQISGLAVGDFNGDGNEDLIAVSGPYGSGSVWVLLGNGDGTFQAPFRYQTGRVLTSVTVGRLRGDGSPADLVVTSDATVLVFLGNGDGTFGTPVSYPVDGSPTSVSVGDFNADGKPDLVVSNNYYDQPGTVTLLLGNGDGTFQPGVEFPVGGHPFSVAVGDFRGNGILDLVVTGSSETEGPGNTVSVLLGNGYGYFDVGVTYVVGEFPRSALVGDFDRHGKADIAVVNDTGSTVSVLRGNGDGTFGTAVSYAVDRQPTCLAAGDFNGDGFPDLVVGNNGAHSPTVLLNAADGTPRPVGCGGPCTPDGAAAAAGFVFRPTAAGWPTTLAPNAQATPAASRVGDLERLFASLVAKPTAVDLLQSADRIARGLPAPSREPAHLGGVPGLWEIPAVITPVWEDGHG